MYKHGLTIDDPQGLICHKTQPNQMYGIISYILYILKQFTNCIDEIFISILMF